MCKNMIAAAFVTGFFALLPASAPAMDDPCTDRSNVVAAVTD